MFFYLKDPNGCKDTIIIIQYYIASEKKLFKYSTGVMIHPDDWDFSARLPKVRKGNEGVRLRKLTAQIMQYNDFLITLVDNCKLNGEKITREKLKAAFDAHFKPEKLKAKLIYLTDFIEDLLKGIKNKINNNTGQNYSPSRITQYKQSNRVFKEFENYIKKRIRVVDYDLKMNDAFLSYCKNVRKNADGTVGEYIRAIKALLHKAQKEGYEVADNISDFTSVSGKSVSVALSEGEIQRIFEYDFSGDRRLENVRDLVILGVWTGLRVSDLMNLPPIDPESKFIEVEPQKTRNTSGAKVIIPLHHQVKEVIRRRGMPTPINKILFNKLIKEVCKSVGIDGPTEGAVMNARTKRKEAGTFPKYMLVSSHTCRRSFATNLYLMNFPTLSIMKITGHTTESSFLSYIKVTPKEHAQKLLEHWEAYYRDKI